jgi:hypothetical protein
MHRLGEEISQKESPTGKSPRHTPTYTNTMGMVDARGNDPARGRTRAGSFGETMTEKKPRWLRRKEAKDLPKGGCPGYVPPKAVRNQIEREKEIRKALEYRAKEAKRDKTPVDAAPAEDVA